MMRIRVMARDLAPIILCALAFCCGLLIDASTVFAQASKTELKPASLTGPALLQELKKGGYVIYFRHFETGADFADQVTADVNNCWSQRQINSNGFNDARRVGKFFYDQHIPVDRVVASPFCRTWQSADLAFGRHETCRSAENSAIERLFAGTERRDESRRHAVHCRSAENRHQRRRDGA